MAVYILPLVGLFFLILGLAFLLRTRSETVTAITRRTYRRLGVIYVCVGVVLMALGIARL